MVASIIGAREELDVQVNFISGSFCVAYSPWFFPSHWRVFHVKIWCLDLMVYFTYLLDLILNWFACPFDYTKRKKKRFYSFRIVTFESEAVTKLLAFSQQSSVHLLAKAAAYSD